MTAPTWGSVVAAVPHDRGCASNKPYACREKWRDGELISSDTNGPCDCTRDARIGAGIAAVEQIAFYAGMRFQRTGGHRAGKEDEVSPHTPLRDEWTGHNRPNYPPEATAQVTAPSWPKVVAAVPHDEDCERTQVGWLHVPMECSCSRDVRIGAGIAAVEAYDLAEPPQKQCEGDCLACNIKIAQQHNERIAAFREASKLKEVEG